MYKERLEKLNALVIGDVMVDDYCYGDVLGVSPEAPVLKVKKVDHRLDPGGAANVAVNLRNLGLNVELIGRVGEDHLGMMLESIVSDLGIKCRFFTDPSLPTIRKMRIIGNHRQHLLRLDTEKVETLTALDLKNGMPKIIQAFDKPPDFIIISDYGKGFCNSELCKTVIRVAIDRDIPVYVDPKGSDWDKYVGATVICPNLKELEEVVGQSIPNEDNLVVAAAHKVYKRYFMKYLLVTRSEKGMTEIGNGDQIHVPPSVKEVYDVCGAGDTVIAVFASMLALGYDHRISIHYAMKAAEVVITKLGTVAITYEQLTDEVQSL